MFAWKVKTMHVLIIASLYLKATLWVYPYVVDIDPIFPHPSAFHMKAKSNLKKEMCWFAETLYA